MFDRLIMQQLAALNFNENNIRRILPYEYSMSWNAVAVAGNQDQTLRIDNGTPFVIMSVSFSPFLAVASGTAIAYTPLLREPDSWTAITTSGPTGNSLQSIDTLRINIVDSAGAWHNQPQRVANFCGRHDAEMSLAQRVVGGGLQLTGTLYNDAQAGSAVSAQLTFKGFRIYGN